MKIVIILSFLICYRKKVCKNSDLITTYSKFGIKIALRQEVKWVCKNHYNNVSCKHN